jgi:dTMP kinase
VSGDAPQSGGRRAAFLAFEGIEGCGKSTQIAHLAAWLGDAGRPCRVTREPGGTPFGDALRDLLLRPEGGALDGLTELFLLEAARRRHVQEVIRPSLEAGTIIIADRYADSSVAYQGGGRGLGVELVERLNALATDGLMPDLTLLLDLPVEAGLARVAGRDRARDRMERERIEFHQRVRDAYLDLARRRGAERYRVIDAAQPADRIADEVRAAAEGILG